MPNPRTKDPLVSMAIGTVKAYGSSTASEYASRIEAFEPERSVTLETEPATETLSEKIESARSALRNGADGATCLRILSDLPDCAEKHYLTAIALMRESGSHFMNEGVRREIDLAMMQDPNNAVYKELGRLVHEEMLADEGKLREQQGKLRRNVDRLKRRLGI